MHTANGWISRRPRLLLLVDEPRGLARRERPAVARELPRLVVRVVVHPLVRVRQHVVRRLQLQEGLALDAAVAVGVEREREPAVRPLDLGLRRRRLELERGVEVEVVDLHRAAQR